MRFRLRAFAAVAAMALVWCVPTQAFADAITFTLGNHPQPGEQNILLLTQQTGMLIQGFTNQTNTEVDYSSTTDVLMGQGGQAKITAQDGEINDITITLPGTSFTSFIFNAFKPVNNDDLLVTVNETDGSHATFQYGDTHGDNFLTIVDQDGAGISSITIDSVGGFQDLRQNRVGGIAGAPVPEPSSFLLLGSGILGVLGYVRRWR